MICEDVQRLIDYAIENKLITPDDVYVIRNQLMEALGLSDWQECSGNYTGESIDDILAPLVSYAVENGMIADTANSRDLFDTKLMGILTPMPREVIAEFRRLYEISPRQATDWYFDISQKLNYVRAGRIAKDMKWLYDCEYGTLDITINCSKPEKDPRDIAAARNQKASAYPKCQLCPENAGFPGHATHPARQNLRPIPLTVNGEKWQIQYSPYGYYNEHCIVFNEKHIPMKIDRSVFDKLFDIIDFLPHYMVGSNADLPIVGGSILSHEHFQGGGYTFAMAKAAVEIPFDIPAYPNVTAGIVKWPMSVIRVSSPDRRQLAECCNDILVKWRAYSDESVGIFAETDGVPHNTITPIARKNGDLYECDLVLRNNITTEERPLGVFHPKPSLHHIKKENIGLIEVMGLAVLPSRLSKEMLMLEKAMLGGEDLRGIPELTCHAEWAAEVLSRHPEFSESTARGILEQEIGRVFLEVLEDAGVYKRNEQGREAFLRFIARITE
ncbi:MAG: UDP-glucose--hexose-1-phosphate uridylyltransferase [Oscillospiraceae bacterium]|nr:UDP-glucose--hexose-1-phosphate uridylyltransferase [Oscillospiraceae bacterium]